jgi:hypothetical protein
MEVFVLCMPKPRPPDAIAPGRLLDRQICMIQGLARPAGSKYSPVDSNDYAIKLSTCNALVLMYMSQRRTPQWSRSSPPDCDEDRALPIPGASNCPADLAGTNLSRGALPYFARLRCPARAGRR